MKLLILGGAGMLGHELARHADGRHDVTATFRGAPEPLPGAQSARLRGGVDARDFATVEQAVHAVRPEAVINCIGVIKQLKEAKDPVVSIEVNALFPHRLGRLCSESGARLIHLSTDCVFSGKKGHYTETDAPDPPDVYGRSKLLGEVGAPPHLTVRTSMIGRELKRHVSLLDWFLTTPEKRVKGYTRAIFSGFTTRALSRILCDVILLRPDLTGLYHVSAEPIDKFTLLSKLKSHYGRSEVDILPDPSLLCDRSLDSSHFRRSTGFAPPAWDEMIAELPIEENVAP